MRGRANGIIRKIFKGKRRRIHYPERELLTKEIIYSRIEKVMEEQKLYLDPDLTLISFSDKLGTNRTYVSQAIHMKNHSFKSLVNSYRVKHCLSKLEGNIGKYNPEYIALMSGFANRRLMDRALYENIGKTFFGIIKSNKK